MNHVAFIRNIMVGRNGLTQSVLTEAFTSSGATSAVSFLATGNIVFEFADSSDAPITGFIEKVTGYLADAVGFDEVIFVRSLIELRTMRDTEPFANDPTDDIYERCVTFLPHDKIPFPTLPMISARRDVEIFAVAGREAFSVTRIFGGKTGYAGALIEKLADVRVTTRNWNTILRLLEKFS